MVLQRGTLRSAQRVLKRGTWRGAEGFEERHMEGCMECSAQRHV